MLPLLIPYISWVRRRGRRTRRHNVFTFEHAHLVASKYPVANYFNCPHSGGLQLAAILYLEKIHGSYPDFGTIKANLPAILGIYKKEDQRTFFPE